MRRALKPERGGRRRSPIWKSREMKQMKQDPVLGHWPADEIEAVPCCPICKGAARATLYEGVEDSVFHCAPGRWDLHACAGCGAAYLGPRPTPESIGRAYSSYYTHEGSGRSLDTATPGSALGRLRRAFRNGYFQRRYGARFEPANRFGWLAMQAMHGKKIQLDRENRHLPRLHGGAAKVLDIGCGDGAFLKRAAQIGWDAWGVEPDARAAARLSGFNVLQGSLPDIPLPDASFDYITLNHVIEHLHDPIAALKEIHRLLKAGGMAWIATPNIESLGRRLFGRTWIGIQSPTHLVLFNRRAVRHAFESAGFQSTRFMPLHARAKIFFGMSHWLNVGRNPFTERQPLPFGLRIASAAADLVAGMIPRFGEEIVAVARKPAGAGA